MGWLTNVETQIETDARDADCTADVLTGGPAGETVSVRAALSRNAGEWQGCLMCWFLNWAVQRGHCDKVLTDAPTPWWVYPRAALTFVAAAGAFGALIRWAVLLAWGAVAA